MKTNTTCKRKSSLAMKQKDPFKRNQGKRPNNLKASSMKTRNIHTH